MPKQPHIRRKPVYITRAKLLNQEQFSNVLRSARQGEHGLRAEVILRLSFNCALRAQEISGLQWRRHILTATGEVGEILRITNDIAKGNHHSIVERDFPMPPQVVDALRRLRAERPDDVYVVYALDGKRKFTNGSRNRTERGGVHPNTLVQYLRRFYASEGFDGVTSHSGRRAFITETARAPGDLGASLRDIQLLVGHRNLETTAGYIEPSQHQRKLVGSVFK